MPVRIVVVGLGGRGRSWLPTVKRIPGLELAAIADPDEARLARAGAARGVSEAQRFRSLSDAMSAARPDAALLVTPNVLHATHINECLDLGLHVLCEKPFVMERADAVAIIAKAREKKLVAQAVQNYRWNRGVLTMRRLTAERSAGEPTLCFVDFHRLRPIHGMPYPLLYNQGIHHLDAVRWVFGCHAISVMAHSWNPRWHDCDGDTIIEATYEMASGLIFHYSGSYATRGANTPYSGLWRIECSEGAIHCAGDEDTKVSIKRGANPPEEIPPEPDDLGGDRHLLADFARAIETGEPPPTRAEDNLNSLDMIWSAIESARSGRKVMIARG